MNIANVIPNSQEWLNLRKNYDTASEASAALSLSKYTSRTALLHQKFTGQAEEVGNAKQAVFDRGHSAEAMARPLAEEIIGSELYPVTATLEVEGLKLLASLDGATMDEEIIWEHKLYSESLAADVRSVTLDPHYTIQMDQQLLVSGAKKCLFMTSDGTGEKMAWCWYESTPEKRATLIAGWKQFAIDLAAYVPVEVVIAPVAKPQMSLPAVSIQVNGSIALVDNLQAFGAALTAYVERINKEPETDQDFADLEATAKTLKNAEEALDAAENGALAQTESIDSMRRTVGLYRETVRTNRLLVEKLVKVEKENRRTKIINDATTALNAHISALQTRLGKPYLPVFQGEFQQVVKGLKSIDSMRDKVANELARCKIETNATADRIQINLETKGLQGYEFLFADMATICLKAPDDFQNTVTARITAHEAKEAARIEAERERIRAEEQVKAEAAAKASAEAIAKTQPEPTAVEAVAPAKPDMVRFGSIVIPREQIDKTWPAKPATVTPPDLKLGQIAERLGFALTADFLKSLGFEPAATDKSAKLYHSKDFPAICRVLIEHIESVCEMQEA